MLCFKTGPLKKNEIWLFKTSPYVLKLDHMFAKIDLMIVQAQIFFRKKRLQTRPYFTRLDLIFLKLGLFLQK